MQEAAELAKAKPKFMKTTVRGYQADKGPRDVHNPRNYN